MSDILSSIPETAFGFRTKAKIFLERIAFLQKRMGAKAADVRILDLGCGNGTQLSFPLAAAGYDLTGIDFHEPSIAYAKRENRFPHARFFAGDLQAIPSEIRRKKFDVIILSDILEHLDDPAALLRELRGILAPGGMVLVSIPNGRGPFEIENFLLRKTGVLGLAQRLKRRGDLPYNHESGHVQFFTRQRFDALLSLTGFRASFFQTGSFLCGPVSGRLLGLAPRLIDWNVRVGRKLPASLVSVWYFELTLSGAPASA